MIDFKRILFPVDMSEEDRKAAPFVKAVADWFGSQIHMLYVEEFIYPICIRRTSAEPHMQPHWTFGESGRRNSIPFWFPSLHE